MSACHILLGRPWELDRGVVYDYIKNTAMVEKDGKKFVLISLKDEEDGKAKNCSI